MPVQVVEIFRAVTLRAWAEQTIRSKLVSKLWSSITLEKLLFFKAKCVSGNTHDTIRGICKYLLLCRSIFSSVFFWLRGRVWCTELSLDHSFFLCWLPSVSQAPQKAPDLEPKFPLKLQQNVGSFCFIKKDANNNNKQEKKRKENGSWMCHTMRKLLLAE